MSVNPQDVVPQQPARFAEWKGMNNRLPAKSLPDTLLRNAVNVEIDNAGRVRSRPGMTAVYNGAGLHSGFSCSVGTFFVESGVLKRLNDDDTATVVRSGVVGTVAYCEAPDSTGSHAVYCSDESATWVVHSDFSVTTWGVVVPTAPTLNRASGNLPSGVYTLYLVSVKGGIESGASPTATITVTDSSAITIEPTSALSIDSYRVYMTTANGVAFYYAGTFTPGGFVTISTHTGSSREQSPQFYTPAPTGTIIRFYHGRMFVVSGQVVYYSAPYQAGRFSLSEQYLYFPSDVTVVEPVDDGLWIVADKTYFLAGADPDQAALKFIVHDTAVPGTSVVDAGVAYWMSSSGAFMGSAGGQYEFLQVDNVAVNPGDYGASVFVEKNGQRQFLSTYTPNGTSSLQSSDWATAESIRKA